MAGVGKGQEICLRIDGPLLLLWMLHSLADVAGDTGGRAALPGSGIVGVQSTEGCWGERQQLAQSRFIHSQVDAHHPSLGQQMRKGSYSSCPVCVAA